MAEFAGKVVLVIGAGKGIGRAISLAFAHQGAILALNDLTPVNLNDTIAQAITFGAQCKDYIYDLAKKMPVEAMIDEILRDWGRIDILVNNAGVHPIIPLLDMDEWDLRRTLDVNLCGPFFTIQLAGRLMRQQGGGVIVNLAASLGHAQDLQNSAAFLASKIGVIGLTRAAAIELAPYNIRVNAICPDWAESQGLMASKNVRQLDQAGKGQIPPGRLSHPEEVAAMVLYLCSSSASSLTGQSINLDGGLVSC